MSDAEGCYRAVFEQAAVGIARVAPDGRFIEVNDRFCEITGYDRARLMQADFQRITHPDDLAVDLANVNRLLVGEISSYTMEKRYVRPTGQIVWVTLCVGLVRDRDGRPTNFVSVVQDISDARRAAQTLTEYSQRLAHLSRRLLSVQEEQRRALARELHDHVGQQLAALKLNLERLRHSHPQLAEEMRLTDSLEITDDVMRQIGDTSLDLRPSILDDFGLSPAVCWYARQQEKRSGLHIVVRASEVERRLPDHIETAAFRIVQEAVSNAIRHGGGAAHISVELAIDQNWLSLNISDDGCGFNPEALTHSDGETGGMGLLSMRERAELLGGQFRLQAAPGAGASVEARLPLA
jgi:two-component system sensor histidine kinase UhpB